MRRTVVYRDMQSPTGQRTRRPTISMENYHATDPALGFLQRPHTVSALLLGLVLLIYVVFTRVGDDTVTNIKMWVSLSLFNSLFSTLSFQLSLSSTLSNSLSLSNSLVLSLSLSLSLQLS
jgi:hypothetical protein